MTEMIYYEKNNKALTILISANKKASYMMFTKLVRKTAIVSTLAFSVLSVASQKSLADQAFVIRNQNQQMISDVLAKYPNSNRWEMVYDMLIGPREAVRVNLKSNQCVFDFAMVYHDGSFDLGRHNICEQRTLTYTGNGGDHLPNQPSQANTRNLTPAQEQIEIMRSLHMMDFNNKASQFFFR